MAISKAEKAGEPSMDEILASIRKIISEEPAGSKKANGPSLEARLDAIMPLGDAGSPARPASKQAVDDILGLADAELEAPAPLPAPLPASAPALSEKGRAGTGKVPSWLFPATTEPAVLDRGPSLSAPSPAQNGIRPFFGSPLPERAKPAEDKAAAPGGAPKPIDLGAIVPQRAGHANGVAAAARPEAKGGQKLPEWRGRAAQVERPAPQPQVLAPPQEPTLFVKPEVTDTMPALSELSAARVSEPVVTSTVLPPLEPIAAAVPAAEVPEAIVAEPAARPEAPAEAPMAEPFAPIIAETVAAVPAEPPKAETIESAPVVVEATRTQVPEFAIEMPAEAPQSLEVALPTADAAGVPKPTMIVDRGPRTKVAGSDLVAAAAGVHNGAVKTLEDTVVDLLRPMLRQWLDENMPRMVEKALRVELAQSVKAKLEQQQH